MPHGTHMVWDRVDSDFNKWPHAELQCEEQAVVANSLLIRCPPGPDLYANHC